MQSLFARDTGVVVYNGLNNNPVARLIVCYALANLFYCSAKLVAKGKWDCFAGDWMRCGRTEVWTT